MRAPSGGQPVRARCARRAARTGVHQPAAHARTAQTGIDKLITILENSEPTFFTAEEYMTLYTTTYNMCTQRQPHDYSEPLYVRYREAFQQYLTDKVRPRHSCRTGPRWRAVPLCAPACQACDAGPCTTTDGLKQGSAGTWRGPTGVVVNRLSHVRLKPRRQRCKFELAVKRRPQWLAEWAEWAMAARRTFCDLCKKCRTICDSSASQVLVRVKSQETGTRLLKELAQAWTNHTVMVRWLTRFFNYLDRCEFACMRALIVAKRNKGAFCWAAMTRHP